MEVGPTTHYIMGGVRVDAESQMSTVPGLFACGECAVGINGANRLGGNSLSDLLVFGQRAGAHAADFAREHGAPGIDAAQVEKAMVAALAPFDRAGAGGVGEGPYAIQQELQKVMQDLVGIVRRADEMERALLAIASLRERAARVKVDGNRSYNPGWHTALDLKNLLVVSEAITRSALARRESRGAHFRDDFSEKSPEFGKRSHAVRRGADGNMELLEVPVPPLPPDLQKILAEMP
jgi:succinate dehydrogenase / fumarate reductase flavoprotein subunit